MNQLAESINRQSPVPFYFQLKLLISRDIENGRWSPGDRIPTEAQFCEMYGVSRTTVRQALAELEAEGTLRRERGSGTFIAKQLPRTWFLQSSHGFHDEAVRQGRSVSSRVLRRELGPLPVWATNELGLPADSEGVILERVRSVDGRLTIFVVSYLVEDLAEPVLSADLANGSLYGALEEAGIRVSGGRRVVEAVSASEGLAGLLEVEPGSPLLFVESTTLDNGRPFECYRAWHRGDASKIEVQVIPEAMGVEVGLFSPESMRLP